MVRIVFRIVISIFVCRRNRGLRLLHLQSPLIGRAVAAIAPRSCNLALLQLLFIPTAYREAAFIVGRIASLNGVAEHESEEDNEQLITEVVVNV
jgi:hypothetical protein